MGAHSEQPDRKPRPLKPWLSDSQEIRTRRDAAEIDISSQDHDVVFEFSRGTRVEKFGATWSEQRYIVRPLVASDWQLQVQSLCVTRNLERRLTRLRLGFSANCRSTTQIENHNRRSLHLRPRSHPEPSRYRNNENRRRC